MMTRKLAPLAAAMVAGVMLTGAARAAECTLDAERPVMPEDPATATAEDRAATISAIKDYQASLASYRECLTAIVDNMELKLKKREAANEAFNASVDEEAAIVEAWSAFNAAYQAAHAG